VYIDEDDSQNRCQYGDILVTTSSETPDEVGMISVFLEKDWFPYLNSFCFGLRPSHFNDLLPEFANYVFRGQEFRKVMLPLAQGSTRFNLSKEYFKGLKIRVPPLVEQEKIADILTSLDDQIEVTELKLIQSESLKRSLMQDLLTGKVRVKAA